MFHNIILTIDILVCIALVLVILMQRSEGGALGMGGGPSGFMTARGAGNLLTRATAVLATLFFVLSSGLTIMGNMDRSRNAVVEAASKTAVPLTVGGPKGQPAAVPVQAPVKTGPTLQDLVAPAPQTSAPQAAPSSPLASIPAAAPARKSATPAATSAAPAPAKPAAAKPPVTLSTIPAAPAPAAPKTGTTPQ